MGGSRAKGKADRKRPNSLGEDLTADRFAGAKRQRRGDAGVDDADGGDMEGTGFLLPDRSTQRILRTARKQASQIDEELDGRPDSGGEEADMEDTIPLLDEEEGGPLMGEDDAVEEEEVELEYDETESAVSEMPSDFEPDAEMYGVDEEETRLLQKFMPQSAVQSRNLADMIMEKIREKQDEKAGKEGKRRGEAGDGDNEDEEDKVDPRVARVYTAIGTVLKRFTSGKIPKAFKILPNLKNWERLLLLTRPHEWSPHATFQATRIFSANLNESMAQRFYSTILLPIIHDRMMEEKKLHPSLYMAIRKALFKPVAFFKGFILPLATDEECTLREALVVASVLQRTHLPPVPTAVTIVKLSRQPFSGPCSVFLRVLIDKKMALPYQAVDALVAYFHRFTTSHPKEEALPVLWHQTVLSFVQRYKMDLTEEQLQLISKVCQVHFHYLITPEIRRELQVALKQHSS